jgi:UDP-glucose 4-epimerase
VDTTRLRRRFGFTPAYTTEQAFADFVDARRLNNVLSPELVTNAETVAGRILSGWSHE